MSATVQRKERGLIYSDSQYCPMQTLVILNISELKIFFKKSHNQGLEEQIAHFKFSQYGPKQAWLHVLMRNNYLQYAPSFCRVIEKQVEVGEKEKCFHKCFYY